MEIGTLLGRVIFDFPEAGKLRENEHEQAFLCVFSAVSRFIKENFANDDRVVECMTECSVDFSTPHSFPTERPNVVCFAASVFFADVDSIGHEIYMSDCYHFSLVFRGSKSYSLLASLDPLYFSIEPKMSDLVG